MGIVIVSNCTKEYSCEDCYTKIDTIIPDTIISNMISTYNIYIEDNESLSVIYVEYTSKYHPDTYLIFNQINKDIPVVAFNHPFYFYVFDMKFQQVLLSAFVNDPSKLL